MPFWLVWRESYISFFFLFFVFCFLFLFLFFCFCFFVFFFGFSLGFAVGSMELGFISYALTCIH
jgi:hypothetical protein